MKYSINFRDDSILITFLHRIMYMAGSTGENDTSSFLSLVDRIDILPPLSDSSQRILALYTIDEENIDIKKLTALIEADTLLTANILSLINNPSMGFTTKITSVTQAITLLGTRILKGFIISFAIKDHIPLDMSTYGLSNEKFNDMCQLQSALLFQWYIGVDIKKAQALVPLALIMEMGKVVFAAEMKESDYADIFTEEILVTDHMEAVEHKYSETSSYFIAGLLFDHWHFSQEYVNTMKALDFDNDGIEVDQINLDILEVIRTAVNIKGFFTKVGLDRAQALVKEFGMDEPAFMHAALRIKHAYEETQREKED